MKQLTDQFQFKINVQNRITKTKRQLLAEVTSIYDPLGWISPTTIMAKILMQELWALNIKWDDEVPPKILASSKNILVVRFSNSIIVDKG